MSLPPPGMEDLNLHTKCTEGKCLPLGEPASVVPELERQHEPPSRMVQQVNYDFFSKPSAPKTTILSCSANPWQQKGTAFTQEVIRRLLRTRKEQNCSKKQRILTDFMQILKNSGYTQTFRTEVLRSGIKGYNTILEQAKSGVKPIYRTKGWQSSARRMAKQSKKRNWLGMFKSCIFVPPTPGAELQKLMQKKEQLMRPGGRENWGIKIIETAGKTLENVLVKSDPFNGNKCLDKTCLPN